MSGTLKVGIRRVSVRYDKVHDVWTMRCDDCVSAGDTTAYWPIEKAFWDPDLGLQRCRACHRARRRSTVVHDREFLRARERRYYRKHRIKTLAYRHRYYTEHRERICAQHRIYYAARKAMKATQEIAP